MKHKERLNQLFLEKNAFSKIGVVVGIEGNKVIIKIDKEKNLSYLFYKGETYRNVGIGSYIKVIKDFLFIVGKIEKEYVKEKYLITEENIPNNSTKYDRFIQISIVGYFKKNEFIRGIKELPFLYNEAFLMSENEVKQIYKFTDKNFKNYIIIGNALFDEVIVKASITKLFAGHIGIFGNTGSGKSNTLARLYHNLFNKRGINFEGKSKFIILDFNGEYTNPTTISPEKVIINLATGGNFGDKLMINRNWLDEEFWSIILQATEKTQKPFIKRSINYYNYLYKDNTEELITHIINTISNSFFSILTHNAVGGKELDAFKILKNCIKSFFDIENEEEYPEIFRVYNYHNGSLCRNGNDLNDQGYNIRNGKIYFGADNINNVNSEYRLFKEKLQSFEIESVSYLKLFEISLGLRLVLDTLDNRVQYDHIAPLFHRFEKRKRELNKILLIGETDFINNSDKDLISISFKNVNSDMKKIIPLLIAKQAYEIYKESHKEITEKTLNIIIDEAHNILSDDSHRESDSWKDYRLEVFEEIVKEGRKFGVFITISSQRPSDISNTIISQLHNVFIHRLVNNNDLRTIEKTISFLDKVSYESIPILPPGHCIFTGTATDTPVVVDVDILDDNLQPKSKTVNLDELWFNKTDER
jgi:uncharacterized protein